MKTTTSLTVLGNVAAVIAQTAPTVQLQNGTLQGVECTSNDVNSFLGIPFALPPVGVLRFAPPLPYNQTFASQDATRPPPACIQFNANFAEQGPQSEDCLFINVWVPANATATSNLPVKVWIYGGGNDAGGISNPTYDGCTASESIIQVSIAYRLGPLGFLAVQELGINGNQGIQDQLLGLRWVQENVRAFGGDPTRVLLFGQSAGAQDNFVISSLPEAPSLISAAIMQSALPGNLSTLDEVSPQGQAFVQALNCSTTDAACVRSAPVSALNASYSGTTSRLSLIVDGTVVAAQPLEAGLKVPAIAGTNANEGTLFVLADFRAGAVNLEPGVYDAYLNSTFGPLAPRVNETYPLSGFPNVFDAISTVETYYTFRCPTRRFLRQAVQDAAVPVYTYSFNQTLTCAWFQNIPDIALGLLRSAHTAEIPFVFGGTDSMPRPNGTCNLTAGEKALSAKMVTAWDNMATNANPGSNWPAYDNDESMGINMVGDEFVAGVVDYSMCGFWDDLLAATKSGDSVGPAVTVSRGARIGSGGFLLSSSVGLSALLVLLALLRI